MADYVSFLHLSLSQHLVCARQYGCKSIVSLWQAEISGQGFRFLDLLSMIARGSESGVQVILKSQSGRRPRSFVMEPYHLHTPETG